ncbi:MAG: transglycosylase domain-containing protein [Brachymonas denitrificans]|jgi:monofunctional biosynthetic peptidoglycan transglycosylase|uniref:transglycosylase domain-containing protein n=1 Tax=Brachymonas denitrificans TaxID=28220 RepID=UPI001BD15E2C|nr:transglycosylase domain-containing protein [Brachymonas denitrificans]
MKRLLRLLGWMLLAGILLQLFFFARIALMRVVDPQSTSFQRSEMARVVASGKLAWGQQWVPYDEISDNLKRAVIASEDSDFVNHQGVEWEAIEQARARNAAAEARNQQRLQQAQARIEQARERARKKVERLEKRGKPVDPQLRGIADGSIMPPGITVPAPKVYGGSTITQQLAKNLLLSPERNLLRKGQELVFTQYLELLLDKERILEIYLNNVEWGEGIFGAEAAAQYYFRKPAAQLSAYEAAKLAVMLPRPRFYEQNFNSGYLNSRASTIAARMRDVELP